MIHKKCQDLRSLKNKNKYFKMLSAAVVIGCLRVKCFKAEKSAYLELCILWVAIALEKTFFFCFVFSTKNY